MLKKRDIDAINRSIKHWQIMIDWVTEQINNESNFATIKPDIEFMKKEIGQGWTCKHCDMCKTYWDKKDECINCPLNWKYGECLNKGKDSKGNNWGKVYVSKTWKQWLNNSKIFKKQLENLKKI